MIISKIKTKIIRTYQSTQLIVSLLQVDKYYEIKQNNYFRWGNCHVKKTLFKTNYQFFVPLRDHTEGRTGHRLDSAVTKRATEKCPS